MVFSWSYAQFWLAELRRSMRKRHLTMMGGGTGVTVSI
jgi:hypothetical protein